MLVEQLGLPVIISELIDCAFAYGYSAGEHPCRIALAEKIEEVKEWWNDLEASAEETHGGNLIA